MLFWNFFIFLKYCHSQELEVVWPLRGPDHTPSPPAMLPMGSGGLL